MPADPEPREAVRIVGDGFPLEFLRPDECVKPAKPPQRGVTICPHPTDANNTGLAVPPDYWIVRESTGELRLWADESFKAKFRRINRVWVPPTQHEPEDIPGMPAFYKALREMPKTVGGAIDREAMERGAEALTEGIVKVDPEAWPGTPPAEGTRRKLILDTIGDNFSEAMEQADTTAAVALRLADAIEKALQSVDIGADPARPGIPASEAMDELDRIGMPRTDGPKILDIGQRVRLLCDRHEELVRERLGLRPLDERVGTPLDRLEGIAQERWGRIVELEAERDDLAADCKRFRIDVDRTHNLLDGWDVARSGPHEDCEEAATTFTLYQRVYRLTQRLRRAEAEAAPAPAGNVRPGTRELRVVLKDVSKDGQPPDYRFIELEDQDRRGVGGFDWVEDDDYKMLVIPYGRDDEWVTEVAYQAAGAATGPLLQDHPDYVFPSERVSERVAELLRDFNIEVPASYGNRLDRGEEPGPAPSCDEARDLTEYEAKLLEDREQARAGESRLMEQRNAALGLLRWLIGDLIPPYPGFEEEGD